MDDDQQFCLRWNNHQSTLISVFDTLLENGTLVDCTLAAEGKFLKAHKVVLSACSPYFAALLSQQYDKHPIFILKDVKFQELRAMMDYMYRGEVNISQDQLAALLKAAESLQIKGLSDNRGSSSTAAAPAQQKQQQSETAAAKSLPPPVPVNKASGLTIENKRPLKSELLDSDLSGSREGSTSPTSRKRKKVRRGSVETNNLTDNHDQHSNSSSHSMHSSLQPQALALTSSSSIVASVPAINNAATSLSSSSSSAAAVASAAPSVATTSANVLATSAVAAAASAAIKKTESVQQQQVAEALKLQIVKQQQQQQQQHLPSTQQQQLQQLQKAQDSEDEELSDTEHGDGLGNSDSDNDLDEPHSKRLAQGGSADGEDGKSINQSELMIEPKNEYDDGQDENVEDLTLDEEELLDDLDQAGPSHGEGSSQGYAQWQMEREQNEAFMAAQDAVGGQHRDAQDIKAASLFYQNYVHSGQRFQCGVCEKSYLRKRHLQRHMRDECIGIPPRFNCDHCDSKFRRKYHLVRHMASKHGIQIQDKMIGVGGGGGVVVGTSGGGASSGQKFDSSDCFKPNNETDNKFSVDALMMKQEVIDQVTSHSSLLQNFKTLLFDYALKNVPPQLQQ